MTTPRDFHPSRAADALAVLESELLPDLQGEESTRALLLLRFELRRVLAEARRWAERHEVHATNVTGLPPEHASVGEHVAYLQNLAAELRRLADYSSSPRSDRSPSPGNERTIREVVQRLARNQAEALLEFQELDFALSEMQRHIEGLEGSLDELHIAASALVRKEQDAGRVPELAALVSRTERTLATCTQIVSAFRQLRSAVEQWGAS
jgi:plasmid stabilization system protein ParE